MFLYSNVVAYIEQCDREFFMCVTKLTADQHNLQIETKNLKK